MELELDTAQELIWRFTTELESGESNCNLCGVTSQKQLRMKEVTHNHILQEHGSAEEVIVLKQFVESSTNFVTIKKGRKDLLSGIPTIDDKEPERLISPVWKFATLLSKEEIRCNLCGTLIKSQPKKNATQAREHIMKEHGTTEAAIKLKDYFEKKTRFDFVNKLPKIKSCKKENKHCKCCEQFKRVYVCENYGFKPANPKNLREHRKLHVNTVCEECGFQSEKWKMKYHIKKDSHRKTTYCY